MILMMKRTVIILWIAATLGIAWIFWFHADWMVIPPKLDAIPVSDKDPINSLPDPNRPYFDGCGNQYDYMGNLINKGTGCQPIEIQPLEGFQGK
jgi:hypothetical protein